jgi:hypothetical protein
MTPTHLVDAVDMLSSTASLTVISLIRVLPVAVSDNVMRIHSQVAPRVRAHH